MPSGSGAGDALAAARVWQKRSLPIAEFLAQAQASCTDASAARDCEKSVEREAAFIGKIASMKALMDAMITGSPDEPIKLGYLDCKKRSLLHHASLADSQDAIRLLVAQRMDCETRDESNCTPLFMAAMHNRLHALRMLIQHHADINV